MGKTEELSTVDGKNSAAPGAPCGGQGPLGPPESSLAPMGWESDLFEKIKAHAKYGAKLLELSRFQAHFWSIMDGSANADMHISVVLNRFP